MLNRAMTLGLAAVGGVAVIAAIALVATPGGQVVLPAGQLVRIHLAGPVTIACHPRPEHSNAD